MAGVTLVELLATVAVLAVVVAAGSASFRGVLASARVMGAENEFVAAVAFARSEAIRRGREVRLSATDSSTASNEWGPGFRVWLDADGNGSFSAASDMDLRSRDSGANGPRFDSVANVAQLRFNSAGFVAGFTGDTSGASTSSFRLCDGRVGRSIVLRATGQLSTAALTCT